MSKLSSKQTDEVKSPQIMNLGVELPEFDKIKYPHGGYGKLRDYGWRISNSLEYRKPDEKSRLVKFEDLGGVFLSEDADKLDCPIDGEGHLYNHLSGSLYFIVGFKNGELRFGVFGDDVSMCYDIYIGEGLFAFDVYDYDYDLSDEWMEELEKPYVHQQAKVLSKDGILHGEDFLSISIFRNNIFEPLANNFLEKMYGHKWSYPPDDIRQVCNCIFNYSRMAVKGVVDEYKEHFKDITSEICSIEGLTTLWNEFCHVANFLFGKVSENDLLGIIPPKELSELCAKRINVPEGSTLYNPFAGVGDIASMLPHVEVIGEENDILLCQVAAARCENSVSWVDYADPEKNLSDSEKKYNYIAFIPPFSLADNIVGRAMDKLNKQGKMVCILPMSFTSSKTYEPLRKKILAECEHVEVVSLPALYSPLTAVELCMLKVTKGNHGFRSIQFMDGTRYFHQQEYSSRKILKVNSLIESLSLKTDEVLTIYFDKLVGNDLNPARYLLQLPEVAEGTRYLQMKELVSVVKTGRATEETSSYISLSELENSPVNLVLPVTKRKTKNVQFLTEISVLIGTIGTLKFGKVNNLPSFISNNIIAIKTNDALITEDYLMHELQSAYVQQQFKAFATGTALKRISRKDLMSIQIAVPSIDMQKTIVAESLKNRLSESEAKLQQQFERYRKEIRTRKHAIVQNLSALDSQWKTLNGFRQRNGGNILANDMIGRINPRPATSFFDTIDAYLITLANQTHHLADVEYDWGKSTNIEPLNFLREYIDTHANDRYSYELKGDDTQKMRILMPTRALRQAIDNIVTNAMSHGFTQMERKDYRIHFSAYSENDKVIILVANNGSALTMQPDMVFAYGASSALNQEYSAVAGSKAVHSGIGGHDTREILQEYGASVEIKSIDPNGNDGYTVVYRLVFNNNIF